jgi:hypothetical protein
MYVLQIHHPTFGSLQIRYYKIKTKLLIFESKFSTYLSGFFSQFFSSIWVVSCEVILEIVGANSNHTLFGNTPCQKKEKILNNFIAKDTYFFIFLFFLVSPSLCSIFLPPQNPYTTLIGFKLN